MLQANGTGKWLVHLRHILTSKSKKRKTESGISGRLGCSDGEQAQSQAHDSLSVEADHRLMIVDC